MEQNLKTLKSAILDKNQKKVKEIFHFLKGSSGCVKKMYENCIEGENAVINSNWDNVSFTYQKIEELLGLLKKEMHNYYEK
jgi:HPt (histidine-containing phosphotransfer) domain-containing protein